jgi:hypothetical protein
MISSIAFWGIIGIWSFFGIPFYWSNYDKIPNKTKRLFLKVVCGPIVWFACSFIIVGYIVNITDSTVSAFERWLRKP